mmetsp:Transcript_27531/g.75146  ORF Transcript_27531/g.75146 Transcript_27531/m.75146 type:complete len:107 (+) Transcript_27531:80-400(+)
MFQYSKHVDFYTTFPFDISPTSPPPLTKPRPTPTNRALPLSILLSVWLLAACFGCSGCLLPCSVVDHRQQQQQQHATKPTHTSYSNSSIDSTHTSICFPALALQGA